MKNKQRLDTLLTERGLFPSREQARAAIMAGEVLVDNIRVDKAGAAVAANAEIRLTGRRLPYVSRGGLKLEKAIISFNLSLNGAVVIDIGASTGGFVDCALQHGASRVYAVDVGHNQLAWKLRNDARVVVLEKINARHLDAALIPEPADMLTADVSFISLTLALPAALRLLKPGGHALMLIKPQFEAGREAVGKGGIVRCRETQREVIERVISFFAQHEMIPLGLDFSPVTGADGNIEYLFHAAKEGAAQEAAALDAQAVVDAAWEKLEARP